MNGPIKIPIAVLKIGEQRVVQSNLEFPEGPVTFKLISGSGPVVITGLQAPPDTSAEEAYAMDEMAGEEELVDEEEVMTQFFINWKYFLIKIYFPFCSYSMKRTMSKRSKKLKIHQRGRSYQTINEIQFENKELNNFK